MKSHVRSLAALCCITAFTVFSADACELRVTTWGGNYQATYESVAKKFEKEYQCDIQWVVGSSPDHLIKARLGQVDVVTNTLLNSIAGEKEGLWLPLDKAAIPNMANLYDNAIYSPYTVYANVGDYVLAYNKDKISQAPTSWNALWDKQYRDHVVIYGLDNIPTLSLTVMEAEQHGGSIDNINPGLKRMAELLKSGNLIGALDVESQMVSLFQTGDAWLGMMATGRMKELYEKGVTNIAFTRPSEGTFPLITTVNITKYAKDVKMAQAFVNYILSPDVQLAFATRNLYAPTVKNVTIPADFKYANLLVKDDAFKRLYLPDQQKITEHKAQWQQSINEMSTQ
ncbi:Extracellular solute-binding protein family 1 [Sodalis praecaptivus]|uniref:Extracellular solute-binding protein family 1 n=1 Tax=Sodalis praecaptivus TaxID=1239307 RepID=W0HWS7_9GAMM|nr:ABC transporter substrate-binding protein [Sodalis praecaptivus]AHF76660.1 Extracellular solute-binding protein family 1 [Sodalis praecaptivus]